MDQQRHRSDFLWAAAALESLLLRVRERIAAEHLRRYGEALEWQPLERERPGRPGRPTR